MICHNLGHPIVCGTTTKVFLWKMSVIYCDSAIQLSLTMFARHSKWSVTFFFHHDYLVEVISHHFIYRHKHHVKVSYNVFALGWLWSTARLWDMWLPAARTLQIHYFKLGSNKLEVHKWSVTVFSILIILWKSFLITSFTGDETST